MDSQIAEAGSAQITGTTIVIAIYHIARRWAVISILGVPMVIELFYKYRKKDPKSSFNVI